MILIKILYTETLRSGGVLFIGKDSWYIQFRPVVPDTRYKPRDFQIPGEEIDAYIEAYQINFERYQNLLNENTDKTEIVGEKNMKIRFGVHRGICLYESYFPIKNKKELLQILDDLQYAKEMNVRINK